MNTATNTATSNTTANTTTFDKVSHKCQYCDNLCFGKQCKQCHLKMVAARDADCCDCSKSFPALRKDGTKRIRCFDCQQVYEKEYVKKCPDCDENFHALSKDGRMFDRCFSCNKKRFTKCRNCENSTFVDYPLCKTCYSSERDEKKVARDNRESRNNTRVSEDTERETRPCKTLNCKNMTEYSLCQKCNSTFRDTANQFMISTCQYDGCGYRGKGYFTYCNAH